MTQTQKGIHTQLLFLLETNQLQKIWLSKTPVSEISELLTTLFEIKISEQVIARFCKKYIGNKPRPGAKKDNTLELFKNEIKEMWNGKTPKSKSYIIKHFNTSIRVLDRFAKEKNFGKKITPNYQTILSNEEFLRKTPKNSNIDYSKVHYKGSQVPIELVCEKHGPWFTRPDNFLNKQTQCPRCAKGSPKAEKEILQIFSDNVQIITNDRNILNGKEIDIYASDYKFGIEYNGLMWHSSGYSEHKQFNKTDSEVKNKHLEKTNLAQNQGIQLFHIFENEWLDKNKQSIWKSIINDKLGLNTKIGARKCFIKEVSSIESNKFLEENHLQGVAKASIRYGLYYNNNLVSLMTFSKGRKTISGKADYELIRFCSQKGLTVQGGASKLFKHFIRKYNPKNVISFANRRWSQGNLYKKLGFELKHISAPNYFYFKPGENVLYSRNKFQKHKLKQMYQKGIIRYFNPEESGSINMFKNGYRKIYDSGNYVFMWVNDNR